MVGAALFLTAGSYGPATAQIILEMSQLSCRNYLEAPAERQDLIAAWMSGYFNAARNMPTVDFGNICHQSRLGHKILPGHRNANLMNAIRKVAF